MSKWVCKHCGKPALSEKERKKLWRQTEQGKATLKRHEELHDRLAKKRNRKSRLTADRLFTRWLSEDVIKLRQLTAKGLTNREIGVRLGRTISAVQVKKSKEGIKK